MGNLIISLYIIAQIESGFNPYAYNAKSKATGLYQITPVCLEDYNLMNDKKLALDEMFQADKARVVADWYLNKRIPQMLRAYKLEVSLENVLASYNWGIGNVKRNGLNNMPNETKNYIEKYKKLNGEL